MKLNILGIIIILFGIFFINTAISVTTDRPQELIVNASCTVEGEVVCPDGLKPDCPGPKKPSCITIGSEKKPACHVVGNSIKEELTFTVDNVRCIDPSKRIK